MGCRGQLLELAERLDQLPALTDEDLHAAERKLNPHHHPRSFTVPATPTNKTDAEGTRVVFERATATLENVTCAVELAEAAAAASRRRWWRRLA